jgi:predicted nucleic acid-binding protein
MNPADTRTPLLLDACVAINLAACGRWGDVLASGRFAGIVVEPVAAETLTIAAPDPDHPPQRVELQKLEQCDLVRIEALSSAELATWVGLAPQLGDGEAASLAVAAERGWPLATDDRKARATHSQLGAAGRLWSTSQLLRTWASAEQPPAPAVAAALRKIEEQGRFRPGAHDPEQRWWQLAAGTQSTSLSLPI